MSRKGAGGDGKINVFVKISRNLKGEQINKTYAHSAVLLTATQTTHSMLSLCTRRFLWCFRFRASRKDVSRYGIIMWPEIVLGGRKRYAAVTLTAAAAATDTIKR